ncbi:hypothetical protein QQS21_012904 [Conoideocrella luteorostrata]|uniref:Uncharacterized protein n=1 Tax=Conoideocrella luteorostrata TaxID=1105319 RepID=A0AAJ0CAB2_9HYPO|nr:hypothetical protein QQS21_012904 [Conoideocrella luteorostrata]
MSPKYKAVIFDIGDVLFTWSTSAVTAVSAKIIHSMVNHPVWSEFERGEIAANTCYDRLANAFSISNGQEVADAFQQARASLAPDSAMIELLHRIRQETGVNTESNHDQVALYAMSNISKEDYDFIRGLDAPWHLFDNVFASGYAGMRKPEPRFYKFVLRQINLEECPGDVIFVDDKLENIEAAREVGLHGVHFDGASKTAYEVERLLNFRDAPVPSRNAPIPKHS